MSKYPTYFIDKSIIDAIIEQTEILQKETKV